jgi:hypothetical protein
MAELNQEKLEKRRKTNKKRLAIFGIIFGIIVIAVIIGAITSEKSEFDKHYPNIKNGLAKLGYEIVKESSQYRQFEAAASNNQVYYVHYGIDDRVIEEYQYLKCEISFHPRPKLNYDWIGKERILANDPKIIETIKLITAEFTNNEVSYEDILREVQQKVQTGDKSKINIETDNYRFRMSKGESSFKCHFILFLPGKKRLS